jgi:hypothetical protein
MAAGSFATWGVTVIRCEAVYDPIEPAKGEGAAPLSVGRRADDASKPVTAVIA